MCCRQIQHIYPLGPNCCIGVCAVGWYPLQGVVSCPESQASCDPVYMEDETQEEILSQFKEKRFGGWGLLQLTAGTGLAVYAVWAGILMPGFRRVPLKLQVPYIPASKRQVCSVMTLLKGRSGSLADLGSGDGRIVLEASRQGFSPAVGYELNPWLLRLSRFHAWRTGHYGKVSYQREDLWKVNLSGYENITVFLAPSVLEPLQKKLLAELPEDAVIVAGRFPFPDWTPCRIEGDGMDRAWAYHIKALRKHHLPSKVIRSTEHTS